MRPGQPPTPRRRYAQAGHRWHRNPKQPSRAGGADDRRQPQRAPKPRPVPGPRRHTERQQRRDHPGLPAAGPALPPGRRHHPRGNAPVRRDHPRLSRAVRPGRPGSLRRHSGAAPDPNPHRFASRTMVAVDRQPDEPRPHPARGDLARRLRLHGAHPPPRPRRHGLRLSISASTCPAARSRTRRPSSSSPSRRATTARPGRSP